MRAPGEAHHALRLFAPQLEPGALEAGPDRQARSGLQQRAGFERLTQPVVGNAAGEVMDVVVAPIIYRVIFQPWTLDDTTAETVVARLFR